MSIDVQKKVVYNVKCIHGNPIRENKVVIHQPDCGCREVEVCSGCGKENCTGCPCGTSTTVKEKL